jgi:hypothetical protein
LLPGVPAFAPIRRFGATSSEACRDVARGASEVGIVPDNLVKELKLDHRSTEYPANGSFLATIHSQRFMRMRLGQGLGTLGWDRENTFLVLASSLQTPQA